MPTLEDALGLLLPYQRRWVDDDARFLAGVWGRQTGKSFSTAGKIEAATRLHGVEELGELPAVEAGEHGVEAHINAGIHAEALVHDGGRDVVGGA